MKDQNSARSKSNCNQASKVKKEIDLTQATWVKEEVTDAEERYAHFLMLQSLVNRLKKYYKHEFGLDNEKRVKDFRRAAEIVPRKVYEFSRPPSQGDLSLED